MKMMRIIFVFIISTIACDSNNLKSVIESNTRNSNQTGINCGFIDKKSKIELIDKEQKEDIEGLVVVVINFDNLETLSIETIDIKTVFIRANRKTLKPIDDEFGYFQKKLFPIIKQIRCWKCEECNKETFSSRIVYNFPFVIYSE